MRAMRQTVLGGPEVLGEVQLQRPEPGIGEVLIRVRAAGLNPTDWKHRRHGLFLGRPPFVLGWDVSGEVEAIGTGVTLFKPGDEVFGMLPYPHGAGSHAEYVTAPARALARVPSGTGHVTAGALPIAALTAWQSLVDTADVQPGQRVLIHAAAGGVGHLAVQIAKHRGAHVIGTASTGKHEFLRGLGADELVDYREVDFAEAVDEVDVVLDTIGGDTRNRSLGVLRRGGLLVTLLFRDRQQVAAAAENAGVRAEELVAEADHTGMEEIARLVTTGELVPTIAGAFPLAEAARAHEQGETNRTTGKLVLVVD